MLKEPKQVLVVGAAAATVQPIVALLQGQSRCTGKCNERGA